MHKSVDLNLFLCWQDPKPLMPRVRLDKEMIDAIGGESDATYLEYKELCMR